MSRLLHELRIVVDSVGRWKSLVLVGLAVAVTSAGLVLPNAGMREAWLLAVIILSGFVVASLGLLMIGHLLGDVWLAPIRDELEPASWTMPLLALLALPLATAIGQLYPWVAGAAELPSRRQAYLAEDWFVVRAALCLAVWVGLSVLIARAGPHRGASALGLALLAATFSIASVDWVMSREPHFWSSLFAFAFAVSQLLAALAAAILTSVVRQGHPERVELQSLERALLTLALLAAWTWFSQFLVVWMANLPDEAAWYVARRGSWAWLETWVAVPVLLLAIALLIPSRARRTRLLAACVLVLVHHVARMIWIIRPAARSETSLLADVIVLAMVGAVWVAWFATGLARYGDLTAARLRASRTQS